MNRNKKLNARRGSLNTTYIFPSTRVGSMYRVSVS